MDVVVVVSSYAVRF